MVFPSANANAVEEPVAAEIVQISCPVVALMARIRAPL